MPAPAKPYPPGDAPQRRAVVAHSDNASPDRQKPRLSAPPRVEVPRQRQGPGVHNGRPVSTERETDDPHDNHSPGRDGAAPARDGGDPGQGGGDSGQDGGSGEAGPRPDGGNGEMGGRPSEGGGDTGAWADAGGAEAGGADAGRADAGGADAGRADAGGAEAGAGGAEAGAGGAEAGAGGGQRAVRGGPGETAGGQDGRPVGRASVPRPRTRHLEANVGRAGNLTPGQRHRTVCNDPFKNHLHRRRHQR
ncbi:hypothetical protein L3i22_095880 [Actinoplanes sp. L3-i22]|nr:hypothetical protein L3i22_095880 [Actinoplanes sp. L3-i22]